MARAKDKMRDDDGRPLTITSTGGGPRARLPKGRHGKLHEPGSRSDGHHRATPRGANEARGGRERAERRGGDAVGHAKGAPRHSRARSH